MSDELRVVMVTTNILDDIEEGLDLSTEPTVILQGSLEAVKAAAKLFGEPVTIAALPAVTVGVDTPDYDAGLLNDWGGGNVDWWQDYIRAEIGSANDYWRSILAAPDLSDPVTVHANMLRGTIAKPTLEQIIHLYGVDALAKALAPVIVREAGHEPAPDPAAIREAALRAAAKVADELHDEVDRGHDYGERASTRILALITKGAAE